MGVYKITDTERSVIIGRACAVADRNPRLQLVCCPITADDLERCFNTPDELRDAHAAQQRGYDVKRSDSFIIRFNNNNLGTDVPRMATFSIKTRNEIFALAYSRYSASTYGAYSQGMWTPDFTELGPEKCKSIAKWIAGVVRARREYYLAVNAIKTALRVIYNTGELLAIWPGLVTLVEDEELKRRLRNPPRVLKNYKAAEGSLLHSAEWQTNILGVDTIIAKGLMLKPSYETPAHQGVYSVTMTYFCPMDTDTRETVENI